MTQGTQRILHLNYGKLYGGVETLLTTLARFRAECPSMEPSFALCEEGRLSQELRAAGVAVHILGSVRISRPLTVRRARRRLLQLLHTENFETVVCHMPWSLAVFGKAVESAGKRLVFWAHGFHTGKGWLERLARLRKPNLAIANSHFTASGLTTAFPCIPRRILYSPVAGGVASEGGHCRSELREENGADADTVVIIQVSRLEAWKGHSLHLEALTLLKQSKKWVSWIVGGPQTPREEAYLEGLKQKATNLGIADRVQFLGQRSDVQRLLLAADIFCQPNQAPEPFGIVFLEALWAGLPVVTTAIGAATEIVENGCGLLVAPDKPQELADALLKLIEHPQERERLSQQGPARARELCDPGQQICKLSRLLQGEAACQ